jgi:hypothetical protein
MVESVASPMGPEGAAAGNGEPRHRIQRAAVIAALAIFCVAGVSLFLASPPGPSVSEDPVREWCFSTPPAGEVNPLTLGATASIPELKHGGAWQMHLRMLRWLGVPYHRIHYALIPLRRGRRRGGVPRGRRGRRQRRRCARRHGCLAGLLSTPELTFDALNPALIPLPASLLVVALIVAAREGPSLAYFSAAVALSMSCSLHLANFALAPAVLAAVVIAPPARRPLLVLSVAAGLFLVSQATLSLGALQRSLEVLGVGFAPAAPGDPSFDGRAWALPALTVAAWGLAWTTCEPARRRVVNNLAILILPSLLALLVLGWLRDRELAYRYFAGLAPAAVILVSVGIAGGVRRAWGALSSRRPGATLRQLPAIGLMAMSIVALLVIAMVLRQLPGHPEALLPAQELPRLARALRANGLTNYEDLLCELRGPDSYHALLGLSTQEGFHPYRRLQERRCPPAAGRDLIWLEPGEGGDAWSLQRYRSGLDWDGAELSFRGPGEGWSPWGMVLALADGAYQQGFPALCPVPEGWSGGLRLRIGALDGPAPCALLSPRCVQGLECQVRFSRDGRWSSWERGGPGVLWRPPLPGFGPIVIEWSYRTGSGATFGQVPPLLELPCDVPGVTSAPAGGA